MQPSLNLKSLTMRKHKFSILRPSGVANKNQLNRWKFPRGETFRPLACAICAVRRSHVTVAKKYPFAGWRIRYYNPFSHNVIIYNSCCTLCSHDIVIVWPRCVRAQYSTRLVVVAAKIWRAMSKKTAITPHSIRKASPLFDQKTSTTWKKKKLLFLRSFFSAAASRNKKCKILFITFSG